MTASRNLHQDQCAETGPISRPRPEDLAGYALQSRWNELHHFVVALDEWGCDDPYDRAAEVRRFLTSKIGLDQYKEVRDAG